MHRHVRYALFGAILVMVGVLAGFQLKQTSPVEIRMEMTSGFSKFQEAMAFVQRNYVDQPETSKMVDDAIVGMLEGLDPHSFYIDAEERQAMMEQMEGSFEGIGIEFNIVEDTIYVVAPISGGPSERVGLLAGDRIVEVDGENVAGVGIANSDVTQKLRGEKGSKVKVGVRRPGVKRILYYTITRDKIPLYSVDFSYMIRPKTGYIKVSRFAGKTHDEFREALRRLKHNGMKELILDLRGNPGGYMEMAERMADDFLSAGRLVVYTEGRIPESKSRYDATSFYNDFEEGALVVLIDYGSASASEIVSGAIQDWDRGLIVGTRSFGKGLVQTEKEFKDGSAMRLVISRYYTPSGRSIQKPYDKSAEEYDMEIVERFERGEVYDPTKIEFPDSLKFKTNSGRTVYGGGGIMPDVFVARDTTFDSDFMTDLISAGVFQDFSFQYGDQHPDLRENYKKAEDFVKKFKITEEIKQEFLSFAESKGVKKDDKGLATSGDHIWIYLKAFIGRRVFNDEAFYPIFHQADNQLQRALELLPQARELEKSGTFKLEE